MVSTLVGWAVRDPTDRLLDPSCGDGRFIALHVNSVGCERDAGAAGEAARRAPRATVHEGDFFAWAAATRDRFTCAAGNPPFIRYQSFNGEVRKRALSLCSRLGADLSGLSSSWAPFLVAAAGLLAPGGRLAFVVPAEIGHAPYAAPLLEFLVRGFALVHVLAYRRKLFPELSEDCWLLYAEGFGGSTDEIRLTAAEAFEPSARPPGRFLRVPVGEWRRDRNRRLRPFLISREARELYWKVADHPASRRLGEVASVGIGYVTGANDFFHLRPSEAERWGIPGEFLLPTVRNGRVLPPQRLTRSTVEEWRRRDEPMLLLNVPKVGIAALPDPVRRYLLSQEAALASAAYKCRTRGPWYSVPDVLRPEFFLTYMSGKEPSLVRNEADCTCANSVHAVRPKPGTPCPGPDLLKAWRSRIVSLSCELEGHPLGGGMLKMEPREAARVLTPGQETEERSFAEMVEQATATLRQWRHHALAA